MRRARVTKHEFVQSNECQLGRPNRLTASARLRAFLADYFAARVTA